VHEPFVAALNQIGVPASFEAVQANFHSIYKTDRSFLCFATSAKHEVEIDGKKLIGSAQRVYENAILQHGSLLIGPYHEEITEYLDLKDASKERMKQYLRDHTCHLNSYRQSVSETDLANLIINQFKEFFQIEFTVFEESPIMKQFQENTVDTSEFSIVSNTKVLSE
jgi:lipoate-protein ligase A